MKISTTLLQISQLGDPILRKRTREVKDVKDKKIQQLIDDLIATVKDVDGVGIAAPQVYRSLRVFILASYPNVRYPDAPRMRPTAIINPKIVAYSEEVHKDWEGCLSIPGLRGLVPRHTVIDVEYIDRTGKIHKKRFKDFVARVFQHEYDHLEGIVFIDRMESSHDLFTEKEFHKVIEKL